MKQTQKSGKSAIISDMTGKMGRSIATASMAVLIAGSAHAAILVSSALDNEDTDLSGSGGIFSGTPGADAAPEIAGVTTTVLSNNGGLVGKLQSGSQGPQSTTLRAVSAANGMDLEYTVTYSPFIFDTTDNATSTRRNGYVTVSSANSNQEREQTTSNADGTEFWRVTIDNVVNSGTTDYLLDGAVTANFAVLSGFEVYDSYVGGVTGSLLGSAGTGTVAPGDTAISLSSPADSFAIVATADDTATNFENRWEGLAVQFSPEPVIPEPGSSALLGLGGLLLAARRRRNG